MFQGSCIARNVRAVMCLTARAVFLHRDEDKVIHKLFVYGLLKKGQILHGYLKNTKFVGEDFTRGRLVISEEAPKYRLHDGFERVNGEVYEITEGLLKTLDYVEGVPFLYQRKLVLLGDNGRAWAYFFKGE